MAANGFSGLDVHEEIHLFGTDLFELIIEFYLYWYLLVPFCI